MSNIQNSLKLISTFANGDEKEAESLLDAEYIQHNLAYATGRDAFVASVNALAQAPVKTTVKNIRAFEDGDKVFLQTIYNFAGAGKQVAFDVFRFNKDGKIAEHWDNLAALTPANPSGHTQVDGTTEKKDVDREVTRQVATNFINDILVGKYPEKLTNYFDGDNYIQHNSTMADGVSGLGAALEALAKQGIKMVYDKVHFVLADSDYALGISEGSFGGKKTTYYDLFRIEDGKIAEHWDVMEELAPESTWKNSNSKF